MSYRWSFNTSEWEPASSQLLKMSGLIQTEEKTRIGRFLFMKDAKSSLIGRLLIRKLIHLKTKVPNNCVKLARDEHNKPILVTPLGLGGEDNGGGGDVEVDNENNCSNLNIKNLNFNISHQGSFVVLASDPTAELVGIDVMNVDKPGRIADTVDDYFRLMNRQFTEDEWRQIKGLDMPKSLSDKKKMTNFTRFWCLKEAYVKAIGVGIVIDLRTVDFKTKTDLSFGPGASKLATDTSVKVNGCLETEWSFEERCLDNTHLVAVARHVVPTEDGGCDLEYIPPEFVSISVDFLLENMAPLEAEDPDWVEAFLKKDKKK